MNIIESFLTKNPCYTAGNTITVKGFMLHSVGCPQPKAKVFVDNWNKESYTRACVHAFIDANTGNIYQTLPWDRRASHAGGSANNTHIGVEMCEPACIKYTAGANFTCSDLETARAAATRTYLAAVELFAMLCKKYNLDPLAPGVIISHKEGNKLGIASGHADPEHLWKGLGMSYTMNTFRKAVNDKMNESKVIYRVQVGAFSKKENAENYLTKLKAAGFPGYITSSGEKTETPKKTVSTATSTTTSTKGNVAITLPILCKGSKSDEVKTLQRLLNALGFTDASKKTLAVDGSFGTATLYALKAYQTANKLEVDGICGVATWTSILT